MKQDDRTDAEIIALLEEAEHTKQSIADFCRAKGISQNCFYSWRMKFHGAVTSEAQHVHALELENAQLKRLLAERDLEVDTLTELSRHVHD